MEWWKCFYLDCKSLQHKIISNVWMYYGCIASSAKFTISTTCDTISSSYEEALLSASGSRDSSNRAESDSDSDRKSVSSMGDAMVIAIRRAVTNTIIKTEQPNDFILFWNWNSILNFLLAISYLAGIASGAHFMHWVDLTEFMAFLYHRRDRIDLFEQMSVSISREPIA